MFDKSSPTYRRPKSAAHQAFDRVNLPATSQAEHYEDALQEAALAMHRTADRPPNYSFVSGRNAVLDYIFSFVWFDKSKHPNQNKFVDVATLTGREVGAGSPEDYLLWQEDTADREAAMQEAADIILGIMRSSRKQQRGRAAGGRAGGVGEVRGVGGRWDG